MPFIVGVPRSGTTLLRLMLDAHPELAIPPETHFLSAVLKLRKTSNALEDFFETVVRSPRWNDFQIEPNEFREALRSIEPFRVDEGIRMFYTLYKRRFGKRFCGDKTPAYLQHLNAIEAVLPEARFIHIIRDGRDVALSARNLWFGPGKDLEAQATDWVDRITKARRQAKSCSHYVEVRYEDLVREPRKILERLCEFLNLPFSPQMLEYYLTARQRLDETSPRVRRDGSAEITKEQLETIHRFASQPPRTERLERWKAEMTPNEILAYERIASELLLELGYERSASLATGR